jgi:hypothetical protein
VIDSPPELLRAGDENELSRPHIDALTHAWPTEIDRRTRALLERPLLPTLLKLAAPNAAVMITQISVPLVEMSFIAKLGVDSLVGVSEVFPLLSLVGAISQGAIGGGASARSRVTSAAANVARPANLFGTRRLSPSGSVWSQPPSFSVPVHRSTRGWARSRRVVTGHKGGKAVVLSDTELETYAFKTIPGFEHIYV